MTALVVDPRTLQALQLKLTATLARAGEEHRMTMYAVHRTVTRIDAAVTSRKARVQQCEQALRACQESDRSDCSHESAALVEAQRRLGSALHARAVAAQAATDYGSRSRASLRRLEDIDAEGQRYLRFKLDRVNAVTAGGSSPRGGSGPATTSPGASAVGAGAVHAAPGLPAGFAMVPVALIDQTENPIHGPQDFTKGYSIEDLDYAFDLLETQVLPGLSAGSDSSAFAAADRAAGSFGRRSLSDTFSGFFGGDAIRLEQRPDGTYSITNGRHRIFVASRFGRPSSPHGSSEAAHEHRLATGRRPPLLAEQLVSTAEQSRSTFTDESRPQFDHRIVQTMRTELRRLSRHVDDLDAVLEHALRLLDD